MARAPALQEIEALPEADRLEGFPHPREAAQLFGHQEAERTLAEALGSGRIHHGWLLAGPEGIGKATLAYRFAAYALAGPEERGDPNDGLALSRHAMAPRMVRVLSHPGLLLIRRPYDTKTKRFAASIPVDEVRKLRNFLAPTVGSRSAAPSAIQRVVIVDQADELNSSSANALLKSLEEPPPQTLFLLITSQPGRLLPTIRSRCRTLALPALGTEDLRAAATQALAAAEMAPPGADDWQPLLHLAQGSVRRLLGLATSDGLKLAQRLYAIVERLPEVDWSAAHALSDEIGSAAAEQKFEAFFNLLLDMVARLIRAAATGEGEPRELALAQRLIGTDRLSAWAEMWETIVSRKSETQGLNLDRKALILDVLARMQQAARR